MAELEKVHPEVILRWRCPYVDCNAANEVEMVFVNSQLEQPCIACGRFVKVVPQVYAAVEEEE